MGRRLTLGESRLLNQVLAGDDLADIAADRGLSQADARQQIAAVVRKVAADAWASEPAIPDVAAPRRTPAINADVGEQQGERRREPRIAVVEPCRVVSFDGTFFVNAQLVERSTSGARLRFSETLPALHTVLIQRANGHVLTAEVVWTWGNVAGVRLTDDDSLSETSTRYHSSEPALS